MDYWTRVTTAINKTAWYNFTEDIDYDGNASDRVRVSGTSLALEFDFTSSVANVLYTISNINGSSESPVSFSVDKERISDTNITFGRVTINGTSNINDTMLANMILVTPYSEGAGFFTAAYLQQGTNHVAGNLQRGDVIKICYEAPQDIGEDVDVRLNLIPKIGTATLTEFITPEVISTERVYLYP